MIDREERIQFFMKNYMPKSEVLYRLPLNMPIGSFWPELLNRRKAGGNILPLHTPTLKPCWYTLTDNMIHASEILAAEAAGKGDEYSAVGMTTAMTEEMYYTTYVEGGQISLEDAMDFLNEGREASNIEELIIWNNRMAWEQMIRNLYYPITENSLLQLAYILTEGMENCAESYRLTETHEIAAMTGEQYRVPPPESIQGHMQELIAFVNDPDIHPLIKSPVAAASLLINRPYPEGNERLSRMVSSMILLRCGYDFFKDVSLSSVIAQENYIYYKNMCEIIREHNDGDLTFFMEYYLDMLVRALQFMKQRELRREQVKMERERELAQTPLGEQQAGGGEAEIIKIKDKYKPGLLMLYKRLMTGEIDEFDVTEIKEACNLSNSHEASGYVSYLQRSGFLNLKGKNKEGKSTFTITELGKQTMRMIEEESEVEKVPFHPEGEADEENSKLTTSHGLEEIENTYKRGLHIIEHAKIPELTREKLLAEMDINKIRKSRIIPFIANMIQEKRLKFTSKEMAAALYGTKGYTARIESWKDIRVAVELGLLHKTGGGHAVEYEIDPVLLVEKKQRGKQQDDSQLLDDKRELICKVDLCTGLSDKGRGAILEIVQQTNERDTLESIRALLDYIGASKTEFCLKEWLNSCEVGWTRGAHMLEDLTALQIVDRVDRCFIIPPELVKECETPTIEMPELKRGYNGLEIKKVYDYAESTVKNTIIPDSTKEKLLSALRKGSITGNRVIPYIAAMIQNRKTYFTSREFSEEMFGEYSDRTLRVSSSEIDMAIKAGLVEKSGWGIKTRYEISPELFEETASTEVAVATEETVTFEDTRRTEEMVKNEDDFWAAITRPDEDEYDDDLWEEEETSEDELISVETA